MYVPPINLTPKLECPFCGLLSPKKKSACVHCGQSIPERYLHQQRREGAVRRRRAKIATIILVPLGLLVLTLLFERAGG